MAAASNTALTRNSGSAGRAELQAAVSLPPELLPSLVPATLAADQGVRLPVMESTADDARTRRPRMLGPVISPPALVVLGEVLGVRFPPLASAIGMAGPAPGIETASELCSRSKCLEREPLLA
jgi:hypothetical protein